MKKIYKKIFLSIFVLFFILSCLFFNIKSVSASSINDLESENNWFTGSSELPSLITDINEIKGKTFNYPILISNLLHDSDFQLYINIIERDYIGVEIDETTHETIQCVNYLQYPYIVYSYFDVNDVVDKVSIFSFYKESSSNYDILYNDDTALANYTNVQMSGSLLSSFNNFYYLPVDDIVERDNVPIDFINYAAIDGVPHFLQAFNVDFLTEQNFLNNISDYVVNATSFYICFPDTDRYTLSSHDPDLLNGLQLFQFIQPYNANIKDKINYGITQYDNGYTKGYSDAIENSDSYRLPFLTGILNVVTDLLAIELLPNIRLGYFILLPLTLGIVGMIFYFWRKD